jgi:uncharacterized YigZ family protein
MAVFSYRTLQGETRGVYREKGSKFLAFAYAVATENEIKAKIDNLKKEYFDARHHCYAWMLGPEREKFRAFDDNEPNHSAGDPILGQIRSKGLTNVLVVVVRYFGGVKLGVGGLINAYKSASEEALRQGIIVEQEVSERIILSYEYACTADLMRMVDEFKLTITEQGFQEICTLEAMLARRHREPFLEKLKLMNAMGVRISLLPGKEN